jgi:hypothetical protein
MIKNATLPIDNHFHTIEIRSLFNPAFCAVVIHEFLKGYIPLDSKGAHFPLLFFVLPITMQKSIREKMQGTNSATGLHRWLIERPEVRVEIAQVMNGMSPFTKQALLFGMQSKVLSIEGGRVTIATSRNLKRPTDWEDERGDIIKKSSLLGKWFAQIEDPTTIYVMFGVTV